jgi:hypothetical protein
MKVTQQESITKVAWHLAFIFMRIELDGAPNRSAPSEPCPSIAESMLLSDRLFWGLRIRRCSKKTPFYILFTKINNVRFSKTKSK